MIFEVYDSKNTDRLLGTLDADPPSRATMFRLPLMDVRAACIDAEYDPHEAPALRTLDFTIEWRSQCEETVDNLRWERTTVRKQWAVLTTSAHLEDLTKAPKFKPAGWHVMYQRICRGIV